MMFDSLKKGKEKTMQIDGIGLYKTREGKIAILRQQGTDECWYGHIPGVYTRTWWKLDGSHNMFKNHDIVEKIVDKPANKVGQ